jgi:hypothetical protein
MRTVRGVKRKIAKTIMLFVAVLFVVDNAVAETISITPSLPEEAKTPVATVLGWLYMVGWLAVFGAGIFGAINLMRGDQDTGKKFLGGAIIGGIILAALPAIINTLSGGAITIQI